MPDQKGDTSTSAARTKRISLQLNTITQRINKIREVVDEFNPEDEDEFFLEEKQSALRIAHREYNVHVAELFEIASKESCESYQKEVLELEETVDDVNSTRTPVQQPHDDQSIQIQSKHRISQPNLSVTKYLLNLSRNKDRILV
jgi:DNA repair ATPase RecN